MLIGVANWQPSSLLIGSSRQQQSSMIAPSLLIGLHVRTSGTCALSRSYHRV
jgi:hypothetical protein